jgi:hypothetical protein
MKYIKYLRVLSLAIIFTTVIKAQNEQGGLIDPDDPSGNIKTQITSLIQARYGASYNDIGIQVIDSLIARNKSSSEWGVLNDRYGTLHGCVLFDADQSEGWHDKCIMGIYKNGQLLWCSDSTFCNIWGGTFSIEDINHDGKIEILIERYHPSNIESRYLWIISWDGMTGTIINGVDGENKNSVICSAAEMFQLITTDTTSPMRIRGYWSDQWITYGWTGTNYGILPSTEQIRGDDYLPANLLSASVDCNVIAYGDSLLYSYQIHNTPTSKQKISLYALRNIGSIIPFISSNLEFWGYSTLKRISLWNAFNNQEPISIGESTSISFKSTYTPCIVPYYAQGLQLGPFFNPDSLTANDVDKFVNNVFNNSFTRSTIGPANLLSPFIPLNFLDTLSRYTTQSRTLGWIKDDATANKYLNYFASAKTLLQANNVTSAKQVLNTVISNTIADSTAHLTSEAYALLRFNTEYLNDSLKASTPTSGCTVKLASSTGTPLLSGALQYYDGSWKDAVNNNDGTFSVTTNLKTISLRMTYEYGTQTKSNVPISNDTIVFQTVKAQIQLQNSGGMLIDTGSVQYYAGAWRTLGSTIYGIAAKELLPANYSFRMTYAYASKDKQQDISTNATVVFQTGNAAVQLQNSQGALMDQGTVQYYSGSWRDFGTTTNGIANKELLPNNYSFRMNYAYASKDQQQDISTNSTVIFRTVNAVVQLRNSQGNSMDQGVVQYYSGAWRDFGTTTNGIANKELLPNNYSFRMTYGYASKDKQQDISTNPTVVFQTVNTAVQLQNSHGSLMDQGSVQYYSGAWRDLGTTTNGVVNKELLPNSYSFRMTYEYVSNDKQQDVSSNNTVIFSTVLCDVKVITLAGQLVNNATVSYYTGAWRQIGTTVNGEITKELLPVKIQFRAAYGTKQQSVTQDVSVNPLIQITLPVQ